MTGAMSDEQKTRFATSKSAGADDHFYAINSQRDSIRRQEPSSGQTTNVTTERPYGALILTIQNTSYEQMTEVAPGTSRTLKRFIKVPMIS